MEGAQAAGTRLDLREEALRLAGRIPLVAALTAGLVALCLLVQAYGTPDLKTTTITMLIDLIMVVGLYTFIGNSGVLSFGHAGFMAIGAYASALLTIPIVTKSVLLPSLPGFLADASFAPVPAALTAAAVATVVAVAIGIPVVRLAGIQASIATFSFLAIIQVVLGNWTALTRGQMTMTGVPLSLDVVGPTIWAVVAIAIAYLYKQSRSGFRLRATREDELSARSLGISVGRERFVAFLVSAFLVGLSGYLYARLVGSFSPQNFYLEITFITLAMLIIGGRNSLAGAIVGPVTVAVLLELLRRSEDGSLLITIPANSRDIVFAALTLAVLILRPEGLMAGGSADVSPTSGGKTVSRPPAPTLAASRGQDAVTHEIIRRYLTSTVEEMVETTRRTAYSTVISEALDFTCALFDGAGRLVAQGAGLPIHVGSLLGAMEVTIDAYGEDFEPGDVVVHNDPYRGGGHQADVVITRPIFHGSERVGFAVNRGHWVDTGGMTPGGWSGTAEHVVQEAILIPPVKLYKGGAIDREIRDFILANVRTPRQDWGDLQAQLASAITADRRLQALIARYGLEAVKEAEKLALEYSRRRFVSAIEGCPSGSWSAADFFEDTAFEARRLDLKCTVTVAGGAMKADFTGTDPQVLAPVNNSVVNTRTAVYIAAIALLDPSIPFNSGFVDLIDVVVPEGCLLHATPPHPLFLGPADPTNKACELVLNALGQALPQRAVAGSYQTGNNTTGGGTDPHGSPFQFFLFGAGGCGARHDKDGNSAEWHSTANCKNESIEQWEHQVPARFREFSLIEDSGGAGRTRGGLGYRRRIALGADVQVSAAADRHEVGAWGLEGGQRGRPNGFRVGRDGSVQRFSERFGIVSPSKFANVGLAAGDEYIIESGGGGGFGDPLERDPELVAADVAQGYVSEGSASGDYGVVLEPGGAVDGAATLALRERMRGEREGER
jgi:N-methylhydantoinase B